MVLFKKYDQKQQLLFPPSLDDFVPMDHVARTIDSIVERLDLSCIISRYSEEGQPAYHPRLMLKVLFYAYSQGITSSRMIEDCLRRDAVFMFLAAMQKPDYRTVCLFRTKYLDCVVLLFRQILQVCMEMDMVGLVNVSIDGTKIKANASRKRSKDKDQIDREIKRWMEAAERVDDEEDDLYGDGSPFKLPRELVDRRTREEKIDKALKRIRELEDAGRKIEESGVKTINLTDEDARLMKVGSQFKPGYNGQLAVDSRCQVIVACDLTCDESDYGQLVPMVEQVEENLDELPCVISTDSGYANYDNLEYLGGKDVFGLIPDKMLMVEEAGKNKYYSRSKFVYDASADRYACPTGKLLFRKTRKPVKDGGYVIVYHARELDCMSCPDRLKCTRSKRRTLCRNPREYLVEEMRQRLKTPVGKVLYKLRKTTVEPVNGNIKYNKNFDMFRLRGKTKAKIEFVLMSIAHNIDKIHGVLNRLILLTALPAGQKDT